MKSLFIGLVLLLLFCGPPVEVKWVLIAEGEVLKVEYDDEGNTDYTIIHFTDGGACRLSRMVDVCGGYIKIYEKKPRTGCEMHPVYDIKGNNDNSNWHDDDSW